MATLTKFTNIELRRVGCYSGAAPSPDFLAFLKAKNDRLCPLTCAPAEVARNGKCVAKTCGVGEQMNAKGQCLPVSAARSRQNVEGISRNNQPPVQHHAPPQPEPVTDSENIAVTSKSASKCVMTPGVIYAGTSFHDNWRSGLCD
jgi:hypothetical protein